MSLFLLFACSAPPSFGPPAVDGRAPASLVSPDAVGGVAGPFLADVGDLDGDGLRDLVVGDQEDGGVGQVVLLPGGAPAPDLEGTWTLAGTPSDFPRALAGGDFDGDGLADLALARLDRAFAPVVDVYAGALGGPATTPTTTLSGGPSHDDGHDALTAADLDGDGYDDLVRVRADGTALDVYGGSAAGLSTRAGTSLAGLAGLWTAIAHDLDGDGRLDLAASARRVDTGARDAGAVYVWLATSAGFSSAPDWTWSPAEPDAECGAALAAGDLDGDGTIELAVGCPGWSEVASGDGRIALFDGEALGAEPGATIDGAARDGIGEALVAADFDGDGTATLGVGGDGHLLLCDALACAAPQRVDADGYLDGVGGTLVVGDHNGDGYADLAASEGAAMDGYAWYGEVWWWAGGPAGLTLDADPADRRYHLSVDEVHAAVLADADGDGRAEIYAGAPAARTIEVAGLDGSTATWTGASTGYGRRLASGDVDGDGRADVIVAGDYTVAVHRGSATGAASTASNQWTVGLSEFTQSPVVAALGDVDGDGVGDLAWADDYLADGDGRVTVVFGAAGALGGRTQAVAPDAGPGRFGYEVVPAGDVDGDGYADVLISAPDASVSAAGAGRVELRRGGAAGLDATAAWAVDGAAAGDQLRGPSVGDLDGDGRGDLVVYSSVSGAAALHLGAGAGYADAPAWTGSDTWGARLLADLDGDGDGELAHVALLHGSGTQRLVVYAGTPVGPGGALHDLLSDDTRAACLLRVDAADMDGDGVADLVLPCGDGRVEIRLGGPRPDDADGDGWTVTEDADDGDATVGARRDDTGDTGPADTGPADTDTGPADTDTGAIGDTDTAAADTAAADTDGEAVKDPGCGCATRGVGAGAVPLLLAALALALRRRRRSG